MGIFNKLSGFSDKAELSKRYHSTLSRRDFLKALGLGGVGLGFSSMGASSVASISPQIKFNDLDEMISSHLSELKRPWWIKEADSPTIEIDWQVMKRFDYHNVMWAAGLRNALGDDKYEQVFRIADERRLVWRQLEEPGYTLADIALNACNHWAAISFLGPRTSPTPEALGAPRWKGTPEEASRLVRAFLKLHGASQVTFAEIETNTTEKLIYSYDVGSGESQGPRLDIIDTDEPVDNTATGYRVIPKKARWVIIYTLRMSDELMRRPLTQIGSRSHTYMYNLKSLLQGQLQNFLRTLGYMCLGEASRYNALGIHSGFAVLSGLGELSRFGHVITPEYGLMQRVQMVITDLPLAPGKPINMGVNQFCRTCKKCAENCPPQAITYATEPSWDTRGKTYHNPGIKSWYWPQEVCNAWIRMTGGCAVCYAVCPYSHGLNIPFRDIFKASVASNSLLNRFWRKADDLLYGKGELPIGEFWDLDLKPWGY